jgi:hypothetical protein
MKYVRMLLVAACVVLLTFTSEAVADDLDLTVISETATTITLGYNAVANAEGYRYYSGTYSGTEPVFKAVARTFDPSRLQVKFAKAEAYRVTALDVSERADGYSLLTRAACNDKVDNDGDGKIDFPADPGCVRKNDTSEIDAVTPPPGGSISPGQSWQTAYDSASADSTISVLAGNHGSPSLTGTKPVTFLGVDGAVVAKLPGNASNVTFENIDINTGSTHGQYNASEPRGANITWRRVDVSGNWASIHTWDSATNFRWLGGSLNAPGQRNCSEADGQPLWLGADNATIDGVSFGVFDSGNCGSQGAFHMEAIRVQGASDIRVRNTTFSLNSDTGSGHIFVTTTSPTARQPRRLTVENTIFPRLVGSYAIQVHGNVNPIDGWVLRNNRFDQGVLNQAPFTNLTACGNSGAVPPSWEAPC